MKKWKLLLPVLLLLLMLPVAQAETTNFGVVFGGTVNMRSAPNSTAAVANTYSSGTWMKVTGGINGFYQVTAPDGRQGWVMQNYLLISSDATGTIGTVSHAGFLNLRKTPSLSAKVLGKYDDGTPFLILGREGDWYHVRVGGTTGYFLASYVSTRTGVYSDQLGVVIAPVGESVTLRSGPGKSYGKVTSLPACTYLMVLQKGNDWWRVAANGRVGYISSEFVKAGHIRADEAKRLCEKFSSSSSNSSSNANPSGSTQQAAYAVVNNPNPSDKLNLRKTASTRSKSLGKYANGTVVTMIAQGDQWCKVRVPSGQTGYMMTEFLSIPSKPATSTTRYVRHPDKTYVNLRSSASTDSRVLVRVSHGATVVVLSEGKTWTKVRYNGYTGYMMTKFLKKQ